ncbi:uncharacterized protein [Epargyreus clarus]|uniref:uncharacterized protein n=1 Tax=Epargyreus clarus TaxID=520877 RepID=UPI003C2FA390
MSDVWVVGGALAVTLGLSRVLGVAPLRLQARGATLHARVSSAYALYGVVLVTLLNILTLAGLALDIVRNTDNSKRMVRGGSNTDFIMWMLNMSVTQGLTTLAAYTGQRRMNSLIYQYNRLNKAISGMQRNNEKKKKRERKRIVICILLLTIHFAMVMHDFIYSVINALVLDKEVIVPCFYGAYYLSYFIEVVVGVQLLFLVYEIHAAMESLNEEMERIITNIHETRPLHKAEEDSLRRIALLYDSISDVVVHFNKEDGGLMLLKFASFNVYLMFTVYYFHESLLASGGDLTLRDLIIQAMWSFSHITGMVCFVEPCHQTLQEVDRFRVLLTDLMYRTQPPGAPSSLCVDVLYKQLVLDTLAFSPLGVCTLTRSLFTAAISTSTTCLVIVVQYRLGNVVKN